MEMNDNMEDFIIEEKRHRELISVIKNIVNEIPKNEIDISSFKNIEESISSFIKSQNKTEQKPNTEQEKLHKSIDNLILNISELKEMIRKNNNKEYDFDVERDFASDKIRKIKVTVINN